MKKASPIFLALLILSSNLGIALGTHFCGGKAVKSAFLIGNYDLDCGMPDAETCENPDWDFNEIKAIPCCENQHSFFKISDRYNSTTKVQTDLLPLLAIFYQIPLATSLYLELPENLCKYYKPPIPKQTFSILYQVFRL